MDMDMDMDIDMEMYIPTSFVRDRLRASRTR